MLPSGIGVLGVDIWMQNLADIGVVAAGPGQLGAVAGLAAKGQSIEVVQSLVRVIQGLRPTGLILRAQDSYILHDARKVAYDHSLSFH